MISRLPTTAALAAVGMVVSIVVGVPLGIIAVLYWQRPLGPRDLRGSLLGVVMPQFVLGFLLLYFFAFKLPWFPLGGSASFAAVILPALALGARAAWVRVDASLFYAQRPRRGLCSDVPGKGPVREAGHHSPRVAQLGRTTRTMMGMDLGIYLGGVLVVEQVFGWPGIGQQMWNAIEANDIPLVMGTVVIAAAAVTILNLIADIINGFLDPRIRYSS